MPHKVIFLDVDGTLTKPGAMQPPPSACRAMEAARANGHRLVLCSGRSEELLTPLLVYPFDAVVSSAGARITCGGELLYDRSISPPLLERTTGLLARSGVEYTLECRDTSYSSPGFTDLLLRCAARGSNSELARWARHAREDPVLTVASYPGTPVYKITFASPDARRLESPFRLLEPDFYCCVMGTDQFGVVNGELIQRSFSKGTAVRTLCRYWGIPIADSVAFGDSMNDAAMLEAAGLGICMGNGDPQLKAMADEVCLPQDQDGLAAAFHSHGWA